MFTTLDFGHNVCCLSLFRPWNCIILC